MSSFFSTTLRFSREKIGSTIRLLSVSSKLNQLIRNVTVIGSGLMGSGIAQVSAQGKFSVVMVDQSDEILNRAYKSLEQNVHRVAKKNFPNDMNAEQAFCHDTLAKISLSTQIREAVASADLIIEAVVENIAVKQRLFAELEAAAPNHALMTTNTSSLALSEISANIQQKENFGGLHFFNPVPVMRLLEVIRIPETSDQSFDSLLKFGKSVGKTTVACKDTPGFIVNRLLVPYMCEAVRMAERGDASIRDIDTAMKLGAGYPMGPFELLDYVGLDTTKFIVDGWHRKHPEEKLYAPTKIVDDLVNEGKLGRKTGEGFFKYN